MTDTPSQSELKSKLNSFLTEGYVVAAIGAVAGISAHQYRVGYYKHFGLDSSEVSFSLDQTLPLMVILAPILWITAFMYLLLAADKVPKVIVLILLSCIGILLACTGTKHWIGALVVCLPIALFVWFSISQLIDRKWQSETNWLTCFVLTQAFLLMTVVALSVGAIRAGVQSKFPITEFNNKPHLLMIVDSSSWYLIPFDEKNKTFSSSHILIEKSELKSPIEVKKVGPLNRAPEINQTLDESLGENPNELFSN